jgi:hypothetical protein
MQDKELQEYYEEQFSMFSSRGWKDFIEDLQQLYDAVDDLTTVENVETLYFRKGQIDILNLILERNKTYEATWMELNA